MESRRFMKELPVELTATERAAKQDEVLEFLDQIEDEEEEKKEDASAHAATIKELKSNMAKIRKQLRSNSEKREVEVEETPDFRTQTVTTTRLDTGAVLAERTMLAEELQTELDTGEPADPAGETVEETWSEPSNVVAMNGGDSEPAPPSKPSGPDDPPPADM